jgi:putative ABC transport system permease protein
VFGATAAGTASTLTREFVRWALLANLLAWPATWIVMNRWLARFAYRTTVGFDTLGLAAVSALAIALATVSAKAVKAALANPVDSIRQE